MSDVDGREPQAPPTAAMGMLIRRPVAEVFEAFVDPEITAQFWFTKGSARLERGAHVRWEWEMYDVSGEVDVRDVEQDRRIVVEWADDDRRTIEWDFVPRAGGTTFVTITESGFSGSADEMTANALDSTNGFTNVLAGAKAFLEHDVRLNLVADRFPADDS